MRRIASLLPIACVLLLLFAHGIGALRIASTHPALVVIDNRAGWVFAAANAMDQPAITRWLHRVADTMQIPTHDDRDPVPPAGDDRN